MTAVNHALTGTAIGLVAGQPLLAIPLAIISHYVCDALPHFGTGLQEKTLLKGNGFRNYLVAEATLCFMIVVMLAVARPEHWLLAAVCAFAAAAPDLLSINRYISIRRGRQWRPNVYTKFAQNIQWFERPVGAVVEVVWLAAALIVITPFIF